MKKCRICNINKNEPDFENSSNGKTTNRCKSCKNKQTRDSYKLKMETPENKEKERQRGREKYYRLGYKKSYSNSRKCALNWIDKYPEKHKASIVSRNIKKKVKGNHLHHWSYNEEHFKDVFEFSIQDHNKIHRFMTYDQETKMYISPLGQLINTREVAQKFYNFVLLKL